MANGITSIMELKNRVMPDLPGCATILIEQAIKDVVRDFCWQTECYEENVSQTLTEDTVSYTITPTNTDTDIMRIVWVKIKSDADDDINDLGNIDTQYYDFNGVATLTLHDELTPEETVLTGLVTRVTLVPKINSSTWDSGLMNRWNKAIVSGVLAQLMDNDKESYGNPRRAAMFANEYRMQVGLAMGERYRAYKTGSIQAEPRSWL